MREEIIKPGIIRRIVEKVENDNGMIVSPETADIILTAFLDTVTDILSEGDIIKLKGYMTIYPQLYKSKQIKNVSDQSIINIPARYGADDVSNLQCTCEACNRFKGSVLPDDFMERITEIFLYQMEKKQGKRLLWKIVHKLLNKMV